MSPTICLCVVCGDPSGDLTRSSVRLHDRGALSQRQVGTLMGVDPSILLTLLNPLEADWYRPGVDADRTGWRLDHNPRSLCAASRFYSPS
jgi:hypothetical protein